MTQRAGAEVFNTKLDAWHAWQREPWGRIRYRIVSETLRRTCADLGPAPLRVIDVGGGDGSDVMPLAEAGHDVTVLDYSEPMLQLARAAAEGRGVGARLATVQGDLADLASLGLGAFDLVLCHNVVQYQPDTAEVIRTLVKLVRRRGALSVIAVNPPSDVLSAVIRRQDIGEAERMLTATSAQARTFGHDVRRVPPDEVETALAECGFTSVTRYGIRVITDYIADDARKYESDFYQQLERLELALCNKEPYLRTARLWQLVARRTEDDMSTTTGTV